MGMEHIKFINAGVPYSNKSALKIS